MPRRAVSVVLTLLLTLTGCTVHKVQQVPTSSVPQPIPAKETIVEINTTQGQDVVFDKPAGATIVSGSLHGFVKKVPYEIPMDQVQRIWLDTEFEGGRHIARIAKIDGA